MRAGRKRASPPVFGKSCVSEDQGVKDRVQQGESSTMERKLKGKRKGGEAGVELSGRARCSHESSPGLDPSQHDYFDSLLSVLRNLQLQLTTGLPSSLKTVIIF